MVPSCIFQTLPVVETSGKENLVQINHVDENLV